MKKFTFKDMVQSVGKPDVLEYIEHTGTVPNLKLDPSDVRPDAFPKYVPGSSCPMRGEEHFYFKVSNRDICSKCGSSRKSRL